MKVKITAIHPGDSFYKNRKDYIGVFGEFVPSECIMKGYKSGKVKFKDKKEPLFFYAFKSNEEEEMK
jgi:hypothetical protein